MKKTIDHKLEHIAGKAVLDGFLPDSEAIALAKAFSILLHAYTLTDDEDADKVLERLNQII